MDSQQSDVSVEGSFNQMFQDYFTNNSILNQTDETMDFLDYPHHPILSNPSQLLNFTLETIHNNNPIIWDDSSFDVSDNSNEYINLDESSSDSGYESNNYSSSDEEMDEDFLCFPDVFNLYSAIQNYDFAYDRCFDLEIQNLINTVHDLHVVQNLNIDDIFRNLSIPHFLNEYPEENIELLRTGIMNFINDHDMLNRLNNVYDTIDHNIGNVLDEPVNEESLPNEIFESLPVTTVDDKLMNELESCVICVEKYSLGENILLLPCKHVFHTQCIKRWFKEKSNCPLCWQLVHKN